MPVGRIAILASIRDCYEPYIRFWIDYHLGIGASHIFIYDNESSQPIAAYGRHVTVTRWPGLHGQLAAYRHGLSVLKSDGFEWGALIDDDEFIVIPEQTLPEFLEGFPGEVGVSLNWRNFGSSGRTDPPPDGDVFSSFDRCFPKAAPVHKHVKTISRVAEVKSIRNPHFCVFRNGRLPVNELGIPVQGPFSEPPSYVNAWINHYYVRSLADYEAKGRRGRGAIEGFPYSQKVFESTERQAKERYDRGRGRSIKT